MIVLEKLVVNEPLEDVLSVFALKVSYPMIDRMYVMHGQGKFSNLDVLMAYQKLVDEGVLIRSGQMKAVKGPNWKQPAFVSEGKYKNHIEG